MNCQTAEKLMPELAAGELTGGNADKALAHINDCAKCRNAYSQYQAAMAALEQRRERVSVPSELDYLRLPESLSPRGHYFRWAAMAAGIIFAALAVWMLTPRPTHTMRYAQVKPKHQQIAPPRVVYAPAPSKPQNAPAAKGVENAVVLVCRPGSHQSARTLTKASYGKPRKLTVKQHARPAQTPQDNGEPIMVVASREEPASIEVESVNPRDGSVKTYSLEINDNGKEVITQNQYDNSSL